MPATTADSPAQTPFPLTAIVPVAGLGTRLRPLTDAIPKEMLPLGRACGLEYVVTELRAVGVIRIIWVVSPAKEALLQGYFGDERDGIRFAWAVQPQMRGLGDAVLCGAPYLDSETAPFLLALGDAVYEEPVPGGATRRLLHAAGDTGTWGLTVQEVPQEKVARYGVVRPLSPSSAKESFEFDAIVEKPTPADAPSRYAAAARYLLPSSVFRLIEAVPPDSKGEVQLTPALHALLATTTGVAVPLQAGEVRHDIGSFDNYFRAFCRFALADPELGAGLATSLKSMLAEAGTTTPSETAA